MSNIVILQIQNSLGVLDDSRRVRGDKEFDRLRHTILRKESSRLGSTQFRTSRVRSLRRNSEKSTSDISIGHYQSAPISTLQTLTFAIIIGVPNLNINEIDLEFAIRLDTDQQWGTSSSSDEFIGEMNGFETKCERTFEFLDDGLDEFVETESFGRLSVPDVFTQDGDGFGIGIGVERVVSLEED